MPRGQRDGGQALIPAGTTSEAYDSDGIRCGYAEANAPGSFLIHVYGNDPNWVSNLIGMFGDARWENGAAKEIRLELRITKVGTQDWTSIKQIYGR